MAYLKLIRPLNLLMTVLAMVLFRQAFVASESFVLFQFVPKLGTPAFILLVLSVVFTAAAGYVINDIFDAEIDAVNRPDRVIIDRAVDALVAYNFYKVLVALSIACTLAVALLTQNLRLATVPVLISVALNFYAQYFKRELLVGNVVVAVCSAFVILLPGLYESGKSDGIVSDQNDIESGIFLAAAFYALFAFLCSLLREVIKDVEDMEGDRQFGCRTVPIAWGIRGAKVFSAVILFFIAGIWASVAAFFPAMKIPQVHFFVLGLYILPLLLFFVFLLRASRPVHFSRLSLATKIYMLAGILSMAYFLNGTGPYLFLQYLNYLNKLL